MLDTVERMGQKIYRGHVASLVMIDFSEAFDSVDRGVLAELGWCGVRSTDWFHSCLSERRQTVNGGSSLLPISHCVTQGSIVGPILFIVLMNDLSSFIPDGRLLSYADITQLLDHTTLDPSGLCAVRMWVEESM